MKASIRLLFIVFVSLFASLLFTPAGSTENDIALLLKNAIPRELLPAVFPNVTEPKTDNDGGVNIWIAGPDISHLEFSLMQFPDITKVKLIRDLQMRWLSENKDIQILSAIQGFGDLSVHFQEKGGLLAPFDIMSQTVRVYWDDYRLEVRIVHYHRPSRQDFSHEQAGQLVRQLAQATFEKIRSNGSGTGSEVATSIPDAPVEKPLTRTLTQEEWEKMKEEVARSARSENDPRKEGYIGFIVALTGDVEIFDYTGRRVTNDPSRRPRDGSSDMARHIRIGDVIRTGAEGLVRIQFADRDEERNAGPSVINIAPESTMSFNKFLVNFDYPDGGKRESVIDLIGGAITGFFKGWGPNSSVSIRSGVTICGIRGSEILVSYDSEHHKVNALVNEGHMDVTNTSTGLTVSLTNNQKLLVDNGTIGPIQSMSRSEWDSLISQYGLQKLEPQSSESTMYAIPELKAAITDLKFFESDESGIPLGKRTYMKRFAMNTTRVMHWELSLIHPAPGRRVDFSLEIVWIGPDSKEFARQKFDSYVEGTWTDSIQDWGWGFAQPGIWRPGNYTVKLFHSGQEITAGTFEIY